MIKTLFSGITGLQANTQQWGVRGDNAANVGTNGFKSYRMDFANLLSQSMGGYTGQEVGSGVTTGKLSLDWTQGSVQTKTNVTDLYMSPEEIYEKHLARKGLFYIDKEQDLDDKVKFRKFR